LTLLARLDRLEPLVMASAGKLEPSVYGIVDRLNEDGSNHYIRRWKGTIGNVVPTDDDPTITIAEVFEPLLLKHKKYKCIFGGRAGLKSTGTSDLMIGDVNSCGSKVYCIRERMKSIKESIYSGIEGRIKNLGMTGFSCVESRGEIRHRAGGRFAFGGMQNMIDFKGSFEFKYFVMEEAARTKRQTIDVLGPTLRSVKGAELWYIWNPESITDPMSLEFINPYQADIDRDGFYEDEYHLIIKTTYRDNPWFMHDESLRIELEKDKAKVKAKRMSKTRFNWIWEGGFNDDIENGVIKEEWFEACVDAHKKLNFEPTGGIVFSFDPADVGSDPHGYAVRHGNVFMDAGEIEAENGNRACDISCGMARQFGADYYRWDCDGLGATLRDNVAKAFDETKVDQLVFKGSRSPEFPESYFGESSEYYSNIKDKVKNKDAFRNMRAQGYINLAVKMRKTWEAVENGVYTDPNDLISFSSEVTMLSKLKAELCRLPQKPVTNGGHIELYTKQEMRKGILMPNGDRIVIPSPNIADSVMMAVFRTAPISIDWGELSIPTEHIA
jgi:phage terminase large subunit